MSKRVFFTILLILAGFAALFTGFTSCESVKKPEAESTQRARDAQQPQSGQSTSASSQPQKSPDVTDVFKIFASLKEEEGGEESVEKEKWSLTTFLFPAIDSEEGLQKALSDKSVQVLDVWTTIKTKNDSKMEKVSELLLWSYSAVVFEKFLLFFSRFIILLIILPLFLIFSILSILRNKDKKKTLPLIIVTVLIGLVIFFAIPLSLQASIFMEKTILPDFGSNLDITVENTMSYFTVFLFTYIIIPILVIAGLIFLTVYISRFMLGKKA